MIQIIPSQKNYPALKNNNKSRPIFYINKNFQFNRKPIVAIVGAREARQWSLEWMENELSIVFERLDWTIISGGARGVDQKAHSLALRAGNETIIMLPSSLDDLSPKSLKSFEKHTSAIFMTEFQQPQKIKFWQYYRRNSWIVSICDALLVIQAEEKSGSMMTAKLAIEAGVPIATLPGSPMDRSFSGNNQLLYDGAHLIRDHKDLLMFLNSINSSYGGVNRCPMGT